MIQCQTEECFVKLSGFSHPYIESIEIERMLKLYFEQHHQFVEWLF